MMIKVNFGEWIKVWRFKQIKTLILKILESDDLKQIKDDWWKFKKYVSDFNQVQKRKIVCIICAWF